MITHNDFTKITYDSNGNPRYVITYWDIKNYVQAVGLQLSYKACKIICNELNGRAYNTKQFDSAFVFAEYGLNSLINKMNERFKLNEPKPLSYYDAQINPILQDAKQSIYKAKIVISHEGLKTNHMDINIAQLEKILAILNQGG